MILLDTNLLIYAFDTKSPHHAGAMAWLDQEFRGNSRIGLPWASILGFVRVVSNPRIFTGGTTINQAWQQAETWLGHPNVWKPEPTERHAAILGDLLRTPGLRAADVPDAHLAALALEHGLILCSTDSGFARFEGLRWMNPLREPPRVRERRQRYAR